MQVTTTREITERVYLDDRAVNEVTKARLLKMVHPGEYLRGDVLMYDTDYGSHRGGIEENVVRTATDLDRAVFAVLAALK